MGKTSGRSAKSVANSIANPVTTTSNLPGWPIEFLDDVGCDRHSRKHRPKPLLRRKFRAIVKALKSILS
ncbi:hypothetical protein ACLKA6_016383 [Drosophila palustris]